MRRLDEAEEFKENWRNFHDHWSDAKSIYDQMRADALNLLR